MKEKYERWAIQILTKIVQLDQKDRDALPGSAMKHIKAARLIMIKRLRK